MLKIEIKINWTRGPRNDTHLPSAPAPSPDTDKHPRIQSLCDYYSLYRLLEVMEALYVWLSSSIPGVEADSSVLTLSFLLCCLVSVLFRKKKMLENPKHYPQFAATSPTSRAALDQAQEGAAGASSNGGRGGGGARAAVVQPDPASVHRSKPKVYELSSSDDDSDDNVREIPPP